MPPLFAALGLAGALTLVPSPLQADVGVTRFVRWRVITLPGVAAASTSYAEPGIAIGPGHVAVADAATANTGTLATVWISSDDGSSWKPGETFDRTGASTGDADVALGPDGTLYAADLGYNPNPPRQPTNPTVFVFRSRDGRFWQGPASFPPPHGLDQPDRPWLFVDPRKPADIDIVNSEGGGNIVVWRSHDHGASFAGPTLVTGGPNSQAAMAFSSRPLFDPTDSHRILMLYETAGSAGLRTSVSMVPPVYEFPLTQLWLATSSDAGATWRNHLVLDTAAVAESALHNGTIGHLLVASAVDARGDLYAVFSIRRAGATNTSIYLIHSTDHGTTWSAPVQVPTNSRSNVMPAVVAGSDGAIYLSWYGSADSDFRDPRASWVEMFAMSADPLATQPGFIEGPVSTAAVHLGGIDTAGTIGSDLGANWGLRDLQSIALDSCGRPRPIWATDNGREATQTAVPLMPCRRRDR